MQEVFFIYWEAVPPRNPLQVDGSKCRWLLNLSCTSQTLALGQDILCISVCPRCLLRLHFTNPTSVLSCPPEQPQCLSAPLLLPENLDFFLAWFSLAAGNPFHHGNPFPSPTLAACSRARGKRLRHLAKLKLLRQDSLFAS